MLSLETPTATQAAVRFTAAGGVAEEHTGEGPEGLAVIEWSESTRFALTRLLELLDDPIACAVLSEGRLLEVLHAFMSGLSGAVLANTRRASHDIGRVVGFIHQNLTEGLSVDGLAQQARMSRAVFHRRFKEATGLSPLRFIKSLRINHAAVLLSGGETVAQAARGVGYASASQFSREFKSHLGKTPSQYRQASPQGDEAVA